MKSKPPLFFRVDAGPQMGWGHGMRCLALAEAWKKSHGPFTFVMAAPPDSVADKIKKAGGDVAILSAPSGGGDDATETVALAKRHGAAWIGVDGYHFKPDFFSGLAAAPVKTFLVDDLGAAYARHFSLVVNFQLHAKKELYPENSAVALLLGPEFLLLREEIVATAPRPPAAPAGPVQVLLTFGASGTKGTLEQVREALAKVTAPPLAVSALEPSLPQPKSLGTFYTSHDVAVSALGTTIWELLRLGVPTVGVPINADHELVGKALEAKGLIRFCAPGEIGAVVRELAEDLAQRKDLAEKSRKFIDGLGAARVAERLSTGA